jgi:hypothetical protein
VSRLAIGPREVVALARYQRRDRSHPGPVLVSGVLAEQLARELRAGGDPGAVRTGGEPAEASAVVRVLAGPATAEDERVLRLAVRALVPVVVVQTADVPVRVPYVLAEDVVECPPGSGFPVPAIADRLAAGLGDHGAALAASLPVVREAVERRLALESAVSAGTVAALQAAEGPRLPVLALAQARLLTDIAAAEGKTADGRGDGAAAAQELALPLGAALATGYAARTLVRRLPWRSRVLDGMVAAGASLALAAVFRRLPRP